MYFKMYVSHTLLNSHLKQEVLQSWLYLNINFRSNILLHLWHVLVNFGIYENLTAELQTPGKKDVFGWVHVGEYLSDAFSIHNGLKQRADLLPLLFDFALVNAIRKVQENQEVLKMNEQIKEGQIEFCECLLTFSSEPFVFPSTI